MTLKEKNFCLNYYLSNNQRDSAIQAGYSKVSAHVFSTRLLKKANIKEEIKRLRDKYSEKEEDKVKRVVAKLESSAFAEGDDFLKYENGEIALKENIKLPMNFEFSVFYDTIIDEETKEVTKTGIRSLKIKMPNQSKDLELLGRIYGIFKDSVSVITRDDIREKLEPSEIKAIADLYIKTKAA